jgi:hypothetical protein
VWKYATLNNTVWGVMMQLRWMIYLISFNEQALSNLAWAFAVSNIDAPLLFNDKFTNTLSDRQNDFTDENLWQLYQWHLWQTGEISNTGLSESLLDK